MRRRAHLVLWYASIYVNSLLCRAFVVSIVSPVRRFRLDPLTFMHLDGVFVVVVRIVVSCSNARRRLSFSTLFRSRLVEGLLAVLNLTRYA